jgi:F420 biosynthesis protein FbiB-like protein
MIAEADTAALQDLVRSRRSIRAFRPDPVPRDVIAGLLRDAVWAPSPHNVQPWRFTVLFDEGDKELLARRMAGRLEADLRLHGVEEAEIRRQTGRSEWRITTAPVVIVCSLVPDGLVSYPDERRAGLEWQMAVQSVGAVLQTVFLLAAARGIGSCWMAAPMYCAEEVRSALRLPSRHAPQALALMGYPASAGKVRERRPFDEVVDLR